MVPMHLIKPDDTHACYRIRFINHDGRTVCVYGLHSKEITRRLGHRIESLVTAKANGDPPPKELAKWIESMPDRLARRMVALGLIELRRFEQTKPISQHIAEYEAAVAARKKNTRTHAKRMAANVTIIANALNVELYGQINIDDTLVMLRDRGLASCTMRHYLVSLSDFCNWMVRTNRAADNPVVRPPMPKLSGDEVHVRRPLTVEEFRRLMAHLDTFDYYRNQNAKWSAGERKIIYWTAVCTALRKSELASLRRCQLSLSDTPPAVSIRARDAKNRTEAFVPIPSDLAGALESYAAHLHPAAKLFNMPTSSKSVVAMFRRDMDGAGIHHRWDTGELVDFHTLRSTAITWWLDEMGLSSKKVQVLARLKTLSLVERYSRKFKIDSFDFLDRSPRLGASPETVPAAARQ